MNFIDLQVGDPLQAVDLPANVSIDYTIRSSVMDVERLYGEITLPFRLAPTERNFLLFNDPDQAASPLPANGEFPARLSLGGIAFRTGVFELQKNSRTLLEGTFRAGPSALARMATTSIKQFVTGNFDLGEDKQARCGNFPNYFGMPYLYAGDLVLFNLPVHVTAYEGIGLLLPVPRLEWLLDRVIEGLGYTGDHPLAATLLESLRPTFSNLIVGQVIQPEYERGLGVTRGQERVTPAWYDRPPIRAVSRLDVLFGRSGSLQRAERFQRTRERPDFEEVTDLFLEMIAAYPKRYQNNHRFVPEISVGNFLASVRKTLGIYFRFDGSAKKVSAYLIKDLLTATDNLPDWTDKVASEPEWSPNGYNGYRFSYANSTPPLEEPFQTVYAVTDLPQTEDDAVYYVRREHSFYSQKRQDDNLSLANRPNRPRRTANDPPEPIYWERSGPELQAAVDGEEDFVAEPDFIVPETVGYSEYELSGVMVRLGANGNIRLDMPGPDVLFPYLMAQPVPLVLVRIDSPDFPERFYPVLDLGPLNQYMDIALGYTTDVDNLKVTVRVDNTGPMPKVPYAPGEGDGIFIAQLGVVDPKLAAVNNPFPAGLDFDFSLAHQMDQNLIDTFWKEPIAFLKKARPVTFKARLDVEDLAGFREERLIVVRGERFLIKSVKLPITNSGVRLAEIAAWWVPNDLEAG